MSQAVDPHAGHPAEGIHLPKPSVTPLLWAGGFMLIAFGIIISGPPFAGTTIPQGYGLSAVGLLVILVATAGWLVGSTAPAVMASVTTDAKAGGSRIPRDSSPDFNQ